MQDYCTKLRGGQSLDLVAVKTERGWLKRLQGFLGESANPADDMSFRG
jgi:hypothetical protein